MSLLNLTNFNLAYNEQSLLKNVNLSVKNGDKIGLIGNNGSGKSSLLKYLANSFDNCYYLSQEIFTSGKSTLQFLESKLESYWEIETVLEQYFGQNYLDYDKNLSEYSGGELMKIFLSLAILSEAEILLLDEPTNHLDKSSQQILSDFLHIFAQTKAFVLVSHNISLLNQNVNQVWNIENQSVEIYGGNYDFFVEQKQLQTEAKARNFEVAKKQKTNLEQNKQNLVVGVGKNIQKIKDIQKRLGQGESFDKFELHFIKNGAQKGAKKVSVVFDQKIEDQQSAMDQFKTFRPPKILFNLINQAKKGAALIKLENFDLYSLDKKLLIKNCHLEIRSGQKLSLTGDNGSGKTTLIQALTSGKTFEIKTINETKNETVKLWRSDNFSYQILTQNYQEILDLDQTLEENLAKTTNLNSAQIRSQLANFLFFTSRQVAQKAVTLSGGEKARLALAILTAQNCDLLILDEPTNNLDLQTLEFFVEALKAYPGALLIISHDQDFLDKLNLDQKYQILDQKLI